MESLLAPSQLQPPARTPGQAAPMAGSHPRRCLPTPALAVYLVSRRRRNLGMFFFLLAFHLQHSGSRS